MGKRTVQRITGSGAPGNFLSSDQSAFAEGVTAIAVTGVASDAFTFTESASVNTTGGLGFGLTAFGTGPFGG